MTINKTGYLKNNFVMANFDLECPIHSGVVNLTYPTGSIPNTTAVEYAINMVYCPSGTGALASGHTFPLEMSNATIFDPYGNVLYSGVPALTYLNWF